MNTQRATPAAALASAFVASLALSACSTSDDVQEAELNESSVDPSAQATEAALVERDPADFTEGGEYPAYVVEFDSKTTCSYFPAGGDDDGYLGCVIAPAGQMPPLDIDNSQGTPVDRLMWVSEIGFATTHDVGGGDAQPVGDVLHPGEQVTISYYTFTHGADGTIRGERDNSWFEISPDGQYSSDHFTPGA
ncbi:hypothetical protein HMPREF3145_03210 [Corynebacterium sp. HMSC05C01]|uniref:hypothetical protein n=1 Tax=Corynebacterium sp. HMSC05C01 TaxID=1581113 RepID=UPI0008A57960|nr:hypothetical protein [Corynebacterium sp. HMSC05C01]OFT71492.1 hypothetical protein HMPREF3145_03210 [Corynebacterium sp. HMSC05C01]